MESLALWKALACFGQEQVDSVLQNLQWRNAYPALFETLDSADKRARYDAMIPSAILNDIALVEPPLYIFAFRGDELICHDKIGQIPNDFIIISPHESLERFGGNQMLEAVDYGTSKVTGDLRGR